LSIVLNIILSNIVKTENHDQTYFGCLQ